MTKDRKILFVTGNPEKLRDARHALSNYNIQVESVTAEIDEIQSDSSEAIVEAKARAAYDILRQPLIVSDASWHIPALGGFPGAYMSYVASWFSPDDWRNLMRDKEDKSAILREYIAYYDGDIYKVFMSERIGEFTDAPAGSLGKSFDQVIKMEGDDITVSQVFELPDRSTIALERLSHYAEFGDWFASRAS